MNKLARFILSILMIIEFSQIMAFPAAADTVTPSQALSLNVQPHTSYYAGISISGTTTLNYGDLACNLSVYNTDSNKGYRVPIYIKGMDASGRVIEVESACIDMPKAQPSGKSGNTPVNVLVSMKAGYSIKSLETGIVDIPARSPGDGKPLPELFAYGVRRDDVLNKVIVTGIVKNTVPHSTDTPDVPINGGIVAAGYGGGTDIIEVQGASGNIPNESVQTFEVTLLAGSLIKNTTVDLIGNQGVPFSNIYGSRLEKGTNIITGSLENNAFNQYIQLVALGLSNDRVVDIGGKTFDVKKNSQINYRFELNQKNDIDQVLIMARQQSSIDGGAEVVAKCFYREDNSIKVLALVSSGYYKDKNLGITVSGLDKSGQIVETNTNTIPFSGNKCQLQLVTTSLKAVTLIDKVKVELAGSMEDNIKLIKYGYRIENNACLVTSVVENGNTIPQIAGVKVSGYNKAGNVVEITGYSTNIPANGTMQFNSTLTDTKDIFKVTAEFVGLVKGKLQAYTSSFNSSNSTEVTGILVNGDIKQQAGIVVVGKDSKGNIIDTNCLYQPLEGNSVTPFRITVSNNNLRPITSISTYTVEANSLTSELLLNAVGCCPDVDKLKINAVVTNGTSVSQMAGIVSIGYDGNGKPIDIVATAPQSIAPLTVTRVQNSMEGKNAANVRSLLYGVPCSTGILATAIKQDTKTKSGTYLLCIQNGSADQDFKVTSTSYDKKGKKISDNVQTVRVERYCAKVASISYNLDNVSKITLKVLDATGKRIM